MKTIREASSNDVEEIFNLWQELFVYHRFHHPVFELKADTQDDVLQYLYKRLNESSTRIFICESSNSIIGMTIVQYSETSKNFVLCKKGYVGETIIRQEFRGLKIGSELLKKAEEWFISNGVDHIELQVSVKNKSAIKFWTRKGFSVSTNHMVKVLT